MPRGFGPRPRILLALLLCFVSGGGADEVDTTAAAGNKTFVPISGPASVNESSRSVSPLLEVTGGDIPNAENTTLRGVTGGSGNRPNAENTTVLAGLVATDLENMNGTARDDAPLVNMTVVADGAKTVPIPGNTTVLRKKAKKRPKKAIPPPPPPAESEDDESEQEDSDAALSPLEAAVLVVPPPPLVEAVAVATDTFSAAAAATAEADTAAAPLSANTTAPSANATSSFAEMTPVSSPPDEIARNPEKWAPPPGPLAPTPPQDPVLPPATSLPLATAPPTDDGGEESETAASTEQTTANVSPVPVEAAPRRGGVEMIQDGRQQKDLLLTYVGISSFTAMAVGVSLAIAAAAAAVLYVRGLLLRRSAFSYSTLQAKASTAQSSTAPPVAWQNWSEEDEPWETGREAKPTEVPLLDAEAGRGRAAASGTAAPAVKPAVKPLILRPKASGSQTK